MKKLLFFIASAMSLAALSGCEKDPLSGGGEFLAQIMDAASGDESIKPCWVSGDLVSVNGIEYVAVPDRNDSTKAVLRKHLRYSDEKTAKSPTPPYRAVYPASAYTKKDIELPEKQSVFNWKSLSDFRIPLLAVSPDNQLQFRSVGGILKVNVKGTSKDTVKLVKAGKYKLECSVPLSASGVDFLLRLPAGNYASVTLRIELSSQWYYEEATNFVIKSNGISEMSLSPKFKRPRVQLWEGGPYWAKEDLQLAYLRYADLVPIYDETGFDKVAIIDDMFENDVLKPEYDPARILWGENWRLPTREEIETFIEKTTFRSVYVDFEGIIKGKTDGFENRTIHLRTEGGGYWYETNELAPPSRFSCSNHNGAYWTASRGISQRTGDAGIFIMELQINDAYPVSLNLLRMEQAQRTAISVRPVSDTK